MYTILPSISKRDNETAKREPALIIRTTSQEKKTVQPASSFSPELFRVSGVWPFDFFPDEIIIEEKRIVVKRHFFPVYATINTVQIKQLEMFELCQSWFFSAIHIKSGNYFGLYDTTIKWLPNNQAKEAKDMVDGLKMRETESIDIKGSDTQTVAKVAEVLGETA